MEKQPKTALYSRLRLRLCMLPPERLDLAFANLAAHDPDFSLKNCRLHKQKIVLYWFIIKE